MTPKAFTLTQQPTENTTLTFVAKYPNLTPETLFSHFTDAQLLLKWWPPVATTDPRLGGRYEMSWPKLERTLIGEYTQFEPDQHLAFTWAWTNEPDLPTRTVNIVFAPTGTGAQLTLTHGPYSLDPADQEDRQGHIEGWTHFLDKLNTALTEPAPASSPSTVRAMAGQTGKN